MTLLTYRPRRDSENVAGQARLKNHLADSTTVIPVFSLEISRQDSASLNGLTVETASASCGDQYGDEAGKVCW